MENELDISRPTIDRAFRRLEELGVISSAGTDYQMTLIGRYLYEEVTDTLEAVETFTKSKPLLEHLPPETELPIHLIKDGKILESNPQIPIPLFQTVREKLENCTEFKAVFPVFMPEYLRMVHEETVDDGKSGHLFLPEESISTLPERYQIMFHDLLDSESCSLWSTGEPMEHAIVLLDNQVVWVGCYGPAGGLSGAIVNETDAAVEWSQARFDSYQNDGDRIFTRGGGQQRPPMEVSHP